MPEDEATAQDSENGPATRRKLLTGMGAAAAGAGILAIAGTQPAHADVYEGTYWSYEPYRVYDSRDFGGRIYGGQTRRLEEFAFSEQLAYVCNLTVTNTMGYGYLGVWNADIPRPQPYSSVNWQGDGKTVANLGIFDAGWDGLKVFCGGSGTSTHFIIDVVGYIYGTFVNTQSPAKVREAVERMKAASKRHR